MKLPALLFICFMCCSGCAQSKIEAPMLEGPWLVNMSLSDIGNIETVMNFDVDEVKDGNYRFHAYSKKNVDRQILGFWKAQMARWFSSGFKYGSLVHLEKGNFINNDSLSGVFTSSIGNFYVNGTLHNGHLSGVMSNGKHVAVGIFNADHKTVHTPLRNYPGIIESTIAITKNKLYDPAILNTKEWKDFENEMKRVSNICDDDATLVMAFFYYSRKYLPFSHYGLMRSIEQQNTVSVSESNISIQENTNDIAYMKITSFGGGALEMDSAFGIITSKGYKTLIVDLRDNTGGGIEAGMAFMRHIVLDTSYGGILLTQKYFAKHTTPPGPAQYRAYPHFSAANFDLLIKGISEQEGICLMVYPQAPTFNGKLYILVNEGTASTCEPIVYWLKQQKLATIVGEKTAGAMLNGEKFQVKDGYTLFLPTATYYTADGYKIDQQGVPPTIKIASAHALDTVLTLLHQ